MKKYKSIYNEAKRIMWIKSKYLEFPDGSITDISKDSKVLVSNGEEDISISKKDNGDFYLDIDNTYDKIFKSGKNLVDFLNKGKFTYIGID